MTELNYRPLSWIAASALFMQSLDATILNTALPAVSQDLNASPLNMQLAIISYSLTVALFIPLTGWTADKYGTKRVFCYAVIGFVLGSIACACSYSVETLVLARILQGLGGAMMMPVARLAILQNVPKNQLIAAWNAMAMAGLIGPVVGPILGGWLVTNTSWHWIFLINIPIGVLGIFFANRYMPDTKGEPTRLDWTGFLLFAGGLVGLTLGLDLIAEPIAQLWQTYCIFGAGIIFLFIYGGYAYWRQDLVLLPLRLFRTRTFCVGMLANLFIRLCSSGIPFLLPLLFQVVFNYNAEQAGWMLAPIALSSVFAKSWVGKLLRRFGYKKTLLASSFSMGIAIALMSQLSHATPVWQILALLAWYGSCMSIIFTAINTLTICDLCEQTTSSGSTYLSIMQQVGIGIGIAVASIILNNYRHFELSLAQSFSYTFLSCSLFSLFLILVLSTLKAKDGASNL